MTLWLFRCKKQMRITLTITATKALNGNHLRHPRKNTCPFVFEMFRCIVAPGFHGCDMLSQIIDVPVLTFVRLPVPGDARQVERDQQEDGSGNCLFRIVPIIMLVIPVVIARDKHSPAQPFLVEPFINHIEKQVQEYK